MNSAKKNQMRNWVSIIFFLILISNKTASSQYVKNLNDLKIQSLTTENGMFGNQVNCIYQDSKGFIWIGTNMGLNRWDGYEFKIFISDPNNKQCFKNGDIISLIEDNENRLWIGTKSDIAILSMKTLKFETTDLIRNHDSLPLNSRYQAFALQDSSFMWIGSADGLIKVNLHDYSIKIYKTFPNDSTSFGGEAITALRISNSGDLWIGTDGKGLNRYNKERDTFDRFGLFYGKFNTSTDTILRNYSNGSIATISEDLNGNLLVGTNASSRFYQNHPDSAGVFDTYMGYPQLLLKSGTISWINKEIIDALPKGKWKNVLRRSRFFVRDKNDFIYFIQENKTLVKIPYDRFLIDNKFQLSDSTFEDYTYESDINLTCLFLDKNDNLWIGTSYGIKMLPNVGNKFQDIPTISANKIESIAESKIGDIYLGTNNAGLLKYVKSNNNIHLFKVTDANSYCDISFDKNDDLWGSNFYQNIFKLDTSNLPDKYRYIDKPKIYFNFKIPELNVKKIFEFTIDQNGTLWAELEDHGFGWIDTSEQTFHEMIPDSIRLMRVKYTFASVFDDKISTLWIGRQGGLIALNYITKKYEQYNIENNSWNNPAMLVLGLAKDDSSRIWFGTRANGLYCFIPSTQMFYHFTNSDGIPDNSVRGVVYHKGTIWMSTTNGISRLKIPNNLDNKKQKLEIRNFGLKDGPFADSFNPEVYLKAKDGQIFFSTEKNLITFYPDSILDNPAIPPVFITELEVNNHIIQSGDSTGILQYSITYTDSLFLDYKENTLSFRYSGLNFINPSYNQFAYMLEGFDTTWIHCGNRRFVSYSNLDPGEYVFRVKASNDDGVWNEQGKSLHIIISLLSGKQTGSIHWLQLW
ncbi:MAG: hypothetical protein IPP71_09690 [Bacteroidetes bacterium]|nr:hypothetical protein [Bacteroidota bacterium]